MRKKMSVFLAVVLASAGIWGCAPDNGPSETTVSGGNAAGIESQAQTPETSAKEGGTEGSKWLSVIPGYGNEEGEYAKGPNGEEATPTTDVELTEEQYKAIQEKGLKAAMLWAGASEWYNAMTDGAKAEFEKMGIEVVATSDAQFDPSKQATDIETTMALKPDILLSLPVDPVSGTRAFKPAVDAGCRIIFADNGVDEYKAGQEYVGIVTGDQYGMGRAAAKLMAEAIGSKGKIGVIYYDVDYLVTNNRDNEFVRTILSDYPDIEIVAMSGFSAENATGEVATAMMTQNPDLNGIYVSWDVAAEPVVSELRAGGYKDCKVVTMDLGGNNDLDMAQGGNVYGKVADMPFQIGQTMAKMAALSILEEEVPSYVVSGTVSMKKDNMVEAWNESLNKDPDSSVMEVLGK